MRRVVLQPIGNPDGQRHYDDTIEHPVVLADHAAGLGADLAPLQALYPTGVAPLWGATPGQGDINVARWGQMSVGDYVLFARNGHVERGATVSRVFRNAVAAEELWGRDWKNQTWELMFSVDELRAFDISYSELNQVLGYGEGTVVRGFNVVNETKSAAVFDLLNLDSDTHLLDPTAQEFDAALRWVPLGGPTDQQATTMRRTEQDGLRKQLFERFGEICALCGQTYPREFLVAAHIKKRSECNEPERLDVASVAMLACKFGCDSLFEEGYVTVSDAGRIELSSFVADVATGSAAAYLQRLSGHVCAAWNPASEQYFGWHRAHRFRRSP